MSGQAAFVTGSSRGIGLAAAVELAKAGFDVALNGRADSPQLQAAMQQIQDEGVSVCKVVMNVAEIARHEWALNKIEREIGPLTTLVNNAGVSVINRGDVLAVTEESYDRCMSINAKAMFFLCQAFARRVTNQNLSPDLKYAIINVTSSNATAVALPRGEYCASKSAAAMISKVFAARLGPHDIPVFDVQPGLIETEMTETVIQSYQERAERGLCLFPRVGSAAEVGRVIAALATGQLPYVTGQTISVDGGMLVPRF